MKKNLISVLILMLVLVNLVLTAILMFSILPETKKANELITTVASAIELELTSGDVVSNANRVPEENKEYHDVTGLTLTLKDSGDGEMHYAVIDVTIALDKTSEGYAVYGANFDSYTSVIKSTINSVVSHYTLDEMRNDSQGAADEILIELQSQFSSDLIVGVAFSGTTYQ